MSEGTWVSEELLYLSHQKEDCSVRKGFIGRKDDRTCSEVADPSTGLQTPSQSSLWGKIVCLVSPSSTEACKGLLGNSTSQCQDLASELRSKSTPGKRERQHEEHSAGE